jgi:Xaa-Pro aminopeptidase
VNSDIEIKTQRIIELLEREKLGGVLLNAQHNFAWITCGGSNGIDLSRENGVASIFVRRDGKRFIVANNIEMPRMLAEEVCPDKFEPVEFDWQDEKSTGDFLVKKAKEVSEGVVATDLAMHESAAAIEAKIAPCRYELTETEFDRFRALGADAGIALREAIGKISPGMSEVEIEAAMQAELALRNISSVVTLVAADKRIANYRHPIPTENRWRKILLLVTCAKRGGLIVNLSRMVCVGDIPTELLDRTESTAFVNAKLWDATRPGVTGADLYQVAAGAYSSVGFGDEINLHHQGGAAGYKTREWVAHPKSADVVKPNQAFSWNPSITGTKVEETIVVRREGNEVISRSPDFPTLSTVIDGIEYLSPGILSI